MPELTTMDEEVFPRCHQLPGGPESLAGTRATLASSR